MAELRTPGGRSEQDPPFDPPRGDEGLDDWFARRLEAQGIRSGHRRFPFARVLAVATLAAALFALGWVLFGTQGGNTVATTQSSTTNHHTTPTGTHNSTGAKKAKKPLWQRIPITVLNGFGGANAAGSAKAKLTKAGWKVIAAADASQPITTATTVVYVPGKLGWAKVVAHRLGLPAPVAIANAPGVLPTQTDGVAIVLGPNLLPAGTG